MSPQTSSTVAVLVDQHGLDSFLALAALRPPKALLLHARERRREAARLKATVEQRLSTSAVLIEVADDTDSIEVSRVYAQLPDDVHLHHTGGTGFMAHFLCSAHTAADRPPTSASCLDEERRVLRYDDGNATPLLQLVDPAAINLQTLLDLSAFDRMRAPADRREGASGAAVVNKLIASMDWSSLPNSGPKAGDRALAMLRAQLEELRPLDGHLSPDGRWQNFRNGPFFEHLVAALVRRAAPKYEVSTGVRVQRGSTHVEIDVLAVGHYRPFVISCTTADHHETVKAKAWEVLSRARQVIGLTARPILATFLTGNSTITPTQLSNLTTIDAGDPAGGVRVLGLADLVDAASAPPARAHSLLGLDV